MKMIILAGGAGTRLHPITLATVKQLLPVYNKPMIYYPLSTAMLMDSKEILIISTPKDLPAFQGLLGDGSQWGCSFEYKEQPSPDGLAQAFILGEQFLGGERGGLILGDNIFHGAGFSGILREAADKDGGVIFTRHVADPQRFGVAEFDDQMRVISIEEKPQHPKSSYAVVGIYILPGDAAQRAKMLQPSSRNELEITDLNNLYIREGRMSSIILPRGLAYYDCGTYHSLRRASNYIEAMETDHNILIGSPEEVAWRKGYITDEQLEHLARPLLKNQYGQSLMNLLREKR